jgi:tetratricopeptide (TPR) repeat protein
MEPDQKMVLNLLVKAGLPDRSLDKYGFPDPGVVLRYYREKMKYIDPIDGKEKSWTQVDLAKRLGVSEVTVRLMETQKKGLDSVERRRVLADILKIPPALLGLTSLTDLVEVLHHTQEGILSVPDRLKNTNFDRETLQLYQDAFHVYSEMYATGMEPNTTSVLEDWIARIQGDVAYTQSAQKSALLRTLWGFHALIAKIYCDEMLWVRAFSHLDTALDLATTLHNADLQAASLYRSSAVHFVQRNYALAKTDLDGALIYAKNASPHIRGTILVDAGLAYALAHTDLAGVTYTQKLLDESEKYAGAWVDDGIMSFGSGKYLLRRARALIALERPGKALEFLDDAEELLEPTQKLKLAFLNIARAECHMKLKRPEFDRALELLVDAFDASKAINSEFNVGHVQRLYNALGTSSYGTSPQVADLGIALRKWHRRE